MKTKRNETGEISEPVTKRQKADESESSGEASEVKVTLFGKTLCHYLGGEKFHTHFLDTFADTGTIPNSLHPEQVVELIEKIQEVITKAEYERREKSYNQNSTQHDLVTRTIDEFNSYYDGLVAEMEKEIAAVISAKQKQALSVTKGALNILFIPVGHGDCTVIQTPGGVTFMIDCGSSGGFDVDVKEGKVVEGSGKEAEARAILRVRQSISLMLKSGTHLDFLILTHPDKDHYNKLRRVFAKDKPLTIGQIYHSATFSKYGEQTWFTGKMFSDNKLLKGNVAKKMIKQVFLRYDSIIADGASLNFVLKLQYLDANGSEDIPPYDDKNPGALNQADKNGGLLIWAEPNCRVSILSSNANQEHVKDCSTAENRGSIVVFIEAFGKKILICGDATLNTEEELIKRYGSKIDKVHVLRVGHHGSGVTSSGDKFIKQFKPEEAWISEGIDSSFHSPSIEVIKRLWDQVGSSENGQDIYFWSGGNNTGYSRYQLKDCAGHTVGGVTFTKDLVKDYLKKRVYLTATSVNPKKEIS
jgi:beta-lactamase superfamily II metal-dependent hydrolase